MKRNLLLALLGLLALSALTWAGLMDEMMKCDACKPFMAKEGLTAAMKSEWVLLNNGAAEITTVPKEQLPNLRTAHSQCSAAVDKISKGEKGYLCPMCSGRMELVKKGVLLSQGDMSNGFITVFSSDKPELQKAISAMVEKEKAMMAEMHSPKQN